MKKEEKEEFKKLKNIKAERGFWLPEEETRFNELFDIHALDFKLKCMKIDLIYKQIEQN